MVVFDLEGRAYVADGTGRLWRMGAAWVRLASRWRAGGVVEVEVEPDP